MPEVLYRIIAQVSASDLGSVVTALAPVARGGMKIDALDAAPAPVADASTAQATLIPVEPERTSSRRPYSRKSTKQSKNGPAATKDTTCGKLVLALLSDGPRTREEIVNGFVAQGFARTTGITVAHKLKREGLLVAGTDTFALANPKRGA